MDTPLYKNSTSYQLDENYDAAIITGFGRNTCVTKCSEGLSAAGKDSLDMAISALDELYPEKVEKNLDEIFTSEKTIIEERRFYKKGKSISPIIDTHESYLEKMKKDKNLRNRDRLERDRAWDKAK